MQSSNLRSVIVTGSNQGIGYCIIEGLYSGSTPYHLILTSRTIENAQKAAEEIKNKYPNSSSKITPRQLDISDSKSTDNFVDWIKNDLKTVDVLINNAAIAKSDANVQQSLDCLNTNVFKTIEFTEKVQPYVADDGKIIVISSGAGLLAFQSDKARETLDDSNLTRDKVIEIAKTFYEGVQKEDKETLLSTSVGCYMSSKALINAYSRWALARSVKKGQQVYVVCPGHCQTNMGGTTAPRTAEKGAETPVYLTNLPFEVNEEIQGKFLRDKGVISWVDRIAPA